MSEQSELSCELAERHRTYVVVAAYNEGKVIRDVLLKVLEQNVLVVVVDDGSTDNTVKVIEDLPLTVLRHSINLGQGAALQTGIAFSLGCGATYIVTFDSDGQHDEKDIPALVDTLVQANVDIVLGSRFLGKANNITMGKRILLKLAVFFTWCTVGIRFTDVHNGLRAFRAEAARKIKITQNRMAHASEILHTIKSLGLAFKEIPITMRYTNYSKIKGQPSLGAIDIVYEIIVKRLFP